MNHSRICHPETSQCMPATDSAMLESMFQSRRQFLARFGQGMGAIGLASLIGAEMAPSAEAAALSPLAPRKPHFKPKAKRVLHIFAQGAPSHIDTFDPKPVLTANDGKVMSEFDGLAFASPFKFSKHGKSGLEISEVFPQLATHADEMCVLRSMRTDGFLDIEGSIATTTKNSAGGVKARAELQRKGQPPQELGAWKAARAAVATQLTHIEVRKGDTIDFSVLPAGGAQESYTWAPFLRLSDAEGKLPAKHDWNAQSEFAGPPPAPPKGMTPWEKFAQALLLTNEFVHVN